MGNLEPASAYNYSSASGAGQGLIPILSRYVHGWWERLPATIMCVGLNELIAAESRVTLI